MRTKPRKAFDLAEVERLASLGLTREQIAAALGGREAWRGARYWGRGL